MDLTEAVTYSGDLYFAASGGTGMELWRTDGTAGGTVMACDVSTVSTLASSLPTGMTVAGCQLFFAADQVNQAWRELFVTQGTQATTQLVKDIHVGQGSFPTDLVPIGGKVVFRARSVAGGYEPWVSDGTAAGTMALADLHPGVGSSDPTGFAALPGVGVIFAAAMQAPDGQVQGDVELYATDGTVAGTVLLRDLEPGQTTWHGSPSHMVATSGRELFLEVWDPLAGSEPHYRDATGGVTLLGDLNPGTDGSYLDEPTPVWVDDHLLTFFTAYEPVLGRELYATDGTPAGTQLVEDIWAGPGSSLTLPPARGGEPPFPERPRRQPWCRAVGLGRDRGGHLPAEGHPARRLVE